MFAWLHTQRCCNGGNILFVNMVNQQQVRPKVTASSTSTHHPNKMQILFSCYRDRNFCLKTIENSLTYIEKFNQISKNISELFSSLTLNSREILEKINSLKYFFKPDCPMKNIYKNLQIKEQHISNITPECKVYCLREE